MQRWVIRALVSLVVAVILLTVVPLGAVIAAIKRISLQTWIASLGIFFVGHYLNALKLRLLIGRRALPPGPCVQAQYAGLVANLGLPGIAGGDLVRAAYLVPIVGTKRVAVASLADRLLDTTTLLLLVVAALPIAGLPADVAAHLPGRAWLIAPVGLMVTAAGVSILRRHPGVASKLVPIVDELRTRATDLLGAVAISLGVQSAFVLTNAWLAGEVGVTTGVSAWFVAWPLSKLIAILPISLGGIGVREAALVTLLAPYGAPKDAVLASGFLWQTVLIVSGLMGLVVTQWLWRPATPARAPAVLKVND